MTVAEMAEKAEMAEMGIHVMSSPLCLLRLLCPLRHQFLIA
jgi:hypothetical protein